MSTLYETIYSLCEQQKITGGRLCKEIGIQRSLITDLKMGRKKTLSAETLTKIAEYFGVSVDYLLGNEQKEKPAPQQEDELTIDTLEYALYGEARDLDEDEKQQVLDLVKLMKKKKREMQQQKQDE